MRGLQNLLDEPWVVVWISEVYGGFCCVFLSALSGALLKMHRSKTKVKKLRKSYGFWQRLLLQPAMEETVHAKAFCRRMVWLYRMRLLFLALVPGLAVCMIGIFRAGAAAVYLAGGLMLFVDLPMLVLLTVLSKPRFLHSGGGYWFEKYHNTEEHDKLL